MISVIFPIYNVEQQLRRSIESILDQTYEDFELILVNDGSTDSSLSICQKYEKTDSRIKVINQKNQGVSAARNTGIDNACGEWIAFVDPDDYVHPTYLERLYNVALQTGADISVCNYRIVYGEKDAFMQIEETTPQICSGYESLNNFFGSQYTRNVSPWGKLVKKELHRNLRYPVGRVQEDAHITYRLFERANKVAYIDEYLYHYYQRKNSIMNHPAKEKFLARRNDAIHAQEEMIDFFYMEKYDLYYKKSLSLLTYTYANACYQLYRVYMDKETFGIYYNKFKLYYKRYKSVMITTFKERIRYMCYYISPLFFDLLKY